MAADDKDPAGRAPPPPATGWGVTIALVLAICILIFTGFESHWL